MRRNDPSAPCALALLILALLILAMPAASFGQGPARAKAWVAADGGGNLIARYNSSGAANTVTRSATVIQFNGTPNGDNSVTVTYNGVNGPGGYSINVAH